MQVATLWCAHRRPTDLMDAWSSLCDGALVRRFGRSPPDRVTV